MPKRSSKAPKGDINTKAFSIVQQVTGEAPKTIPVKSEPKPEKNPAAVALGRLGGAKGGKARAASLTPEKRAQIATKAAIARWGRKQS
jgi:hypothetical protein